MFIWNKYKSIFMMLMILKLALAGIAHAAHNHKGYGIYELPVRSHLDLGYTFSQFECPRPANVLAAFEPTRLSSDPTACYEKNKLVDTVPTICYENIDNMPYNPPTNCPDGTVLPSVCPNETVPTRCPASGYESTYCRTQSVATQCPDAVLPTYCNYADIRSGNPTVPTKCNGRTTETTTECASDTTVATHCLYEDGTMQTVPTYCPAAKDDDFGVTWPTLCEYEHTAYDGPLTIPTYCPDGQVIATQCPNDWRVASTHCLIDEYSPLTPTHCTDGSKVATYCPDQEALPTRCPYDEVSPTVCPDGQEICGDQH